MGPYKVLFAPASEIQRGLLTRRGARKEDCRGVCDA